MFDAKDGYAWEYLAYSLEEGTPEPGAELREEILAAYERASNLERTNPLYRGRWLAFRARTGERVAADVNRYMRYFSASQFPESTVSFLTERPLRKLSSRGASDQIQEIADAWGWRLRRHSNLRQLLDG